MRYNERDLVAVSAGPADLEGRLSHRPPRAGLRDERPRQRWFKLRHNLLFYFRLNEHGGVEEGPPAGLLVLERCDVRLEPFAQTHSFSLTERTEPRRCHTLTALSAAAAQRWVAALGQASYEQRRRQLRALTSQLRTLTGSDPLQRFPGARALKNLASVDEEKPAGGGGRVGARAPTFRSHLTGAEAAAQSEPTTGDDGRRH